MNAIIGVRVGKHGAESPAHAPAWENCKYLKVVTTDKGDSLTLATAEGERTFTRGEVAVIPALFPHRIAGKAENAITVLIEQPLLPLKSAAVFADVAGDGVRTAAEQAATFYNADGAEGVLCALGELIVSYLQLLCSKKEKSPVVAMLREDIERNAQDYAYSVEQCIRKLPLNYDYVRKLFKKETGLTPHEYLTSVRMERARKIITSGVSNRYSAYTVGQIAEACGYAEPLYFSRVFKKYFGVSPTEYSKRK